MIKAKIASAAALLLVGVCACSGNNVPSNRIPVSVPSAAPGGESLSGAPNESGAECAEDLSGVETIFAAQELPFLRDYIYDWCVFCSAPATNAEIPRDKKLFSFLVQQTIAVEKWQGNELEATGDPAWGLVYVPVEKIRQAARMVLGETLDLAPYQENLLPIPVEAWDEETLKALEFPSIFYVPEKDAFVGNTIYGYDLTDVTGLTVTAQDSRLTAVLETRQGKRLYHFIFLEKPSPFPMLECVEME